MKKNFNRYVWMFIFFKPRQLFRIAKATIFLLLFVVVNVFTGEAYSQNEKQSTKPIKGTITDENDLPLPGVSVYVKGSSKGTISNIDGKYTIEVTEENTTLVFSLMGYKTHEVVVGNQSNIDVKLTPDAIGLDDVVVVGYGTRKKSQLTGSIGTISKKELKELPVARVDQAIQGRIAGVEIQNNDASPNGWTSIRIRGANSINGGNDPLIVIDGFQGGSLNQINPNDVKSIEVLKDASATAIYGSRGANGVVLITTKQADTEKTTVTYNSYMKFHNVAKKLDLMDAVSYAETVNANRTELGKNPEFTDEEIAGFRTNGGTDWQDEIYRRGFSQNHHIGLSGSGKKFTYNLSGEYVDQKGIVENSSYKRFAVRPNMNFTITKKLKLEMNAYLAKEINHPIRQNDFGGSAIYSAQVWAPVKPVYDEEGNYTLPGGGYGPTLNSNPLGQVLEPVNDNFNNTTSLSLGLNYKIIDGLTLNIMGGYRSYDSESNWFSNAKIKQNYGEETAGISNGRRMTLQNTNMLVYEKDIDNHSITLTGVFEQQYQEINGSSVMVEGPLLNAFTYNNLGGGAEFFPPSSSRTKRQLMSYMGRVNYAFNDKYLLTVTARSDGSSVFGANNKWAFFPSAALGWNVTKEEFLKNNKVLTNLKIRGSWGVVGNQAIAPYTTLQRLSVGGAAASFPIDGLNLSTGVNLASEAPNPNLKWETTTQTDFGFDAHLLEGMFQITFDYYNKQTEDLLQYAPMPATSGASTVLKNIGKVENKGIELYIGATPVNGKLVWKTGVTYHRNRNKVVDLGDVDEMVIGGTKLPGFENSIWLEKGQPLGLFRGLEYAGVWKTSEAEEAAQYSRGGAAFFPGAPKFVDQNGDKIIDDEDIVNIGHKHPDYTFGWNNTLTYKGFELNMFIQGVQGKNNFHVARQRVETTSADGDATSTKIMERWSTDNENTDVPSFLGYNTFPVRNSSRWIEDASYIRLKTLNFGYNLPNGVISKLGIASAKIYFSGANLLTITNYSGYDPEASTGSDAWGGVDLAAYPSQKIYTLGLNIKF